MMSNLCPKCGHSYLNCGCKPSKEDINEKTLRLLDLQTELALRQIDQIKMQQSRETE